MPKRKLCDLFHKLPFDVQAHIACHVDIPGGAKYYVDGQIQRRNAREARGHGIGGYNMSLPLSDTQRQQLVNRILARLFARQNNRVSTVAAVMSKIIDLLTHFASQPIWNFTYPHDPSNLQSHICHFRDCVWSKIGKGIKEMAGAYVMTYYIENATRSRQKDCQLRPLIVFLASQRKNGLAVFVRSIKDCLHTCPDAFLETFIIMVFLQPDVYEQSLRFNLQLRCLKAAHNHATKFWYKWQADS